MRVRKAIGTLLILLVAAMPILASHAWSDYHWYRECALCPARINLYASASNDWYSHLQAAVYGDPYNPNTQNRAGWAYSAVLLLDVIPSASDAPVRAECPPHPGAMRVCSDTYGTTGWTGLVQLDIYDSHIEWGTTKMNDTYLSSAPSSLRRHAICHEVGHNFGLGHTSVDGSSQDTCMDYYQNPSDTDWASTGPNSHDFDQLIAQYDWHQSTFGPRPNPLALRFGAGPAQTSNEPWQWGTPVGWDPQGRANSFRMTFGADLHGRERAMVTHVTWANFPPAEPVIPADLDRQ